MNQCPKEWDLAAHLLWQQGSRQPAIDAVLALLNKHGPGKPVALVLQLVYYIFLVGDPASAAAFLEMQRAHHPQHPELLLNLAVCLSLSRQPGPAVERIHELLRLEPDNVVAHDSLCNCLSQLGQFEQAAVAGSRALTLKDLGHRLPPQAWRLPDARPADWAGAPGKAAVVAFSLWGTNPRYLRGAIDNALMAPQVYPGWTLRFFVDDSVPAELCRTLKALGADLVLEPPGQGMRQRLAWRFKVANDPTVGRFLVRDVDSVVNLRERAAVDEWLASECWFHVMRDWWTHTDLMLAGMWGGVAGVLPDLTDLLNNYQPATAETPNIDQLFLREKVWACVRQSCLVHDRCFTPSGASLWPEADPPGNAHVGQDLFAAGRAAQEARLAPWLDKLPSLRLASPGPLSAVAAVAVAA